MTTATKNTTPQQITSALMQYLQQHAPKRGAWAIGVNEYATEIAQNLEYLDEERDFHAPKIVERGLLNGAQNWQEYSEGGCSLIYDDDIARRLCSPSELKRVQYKQGGYRNPNSRENWIDCQARALRQAAILVIRTLEESDFWDFVAAR